jgi:hypothetical protein
VEPLAVHERFTVYTGAGIAVPTRATPVGAFVALLANEAVVDAVPLAVGVNVTVYVALCPAGIVTGNVSPLIVNSEPTTLTDETVTLAVAAVSCPVAVPLVPTATLPGIVTVAGFAVSVPAAATAVPVKGIDKLGFEAFEVTVTVPLNVPADVGANVTVKDVLCPAVSVTGGVIPEMLNPLPAAVAADIVALVPPVFVTVSV